MFQSIMNKIGLGAKSNPEASKSDVEPSKVTTAPPETMLEAEVLLPTGSRTSGLKDAVLSGWFNHATGELLEGFCIKPEDIVLDVGCGEGSATIFSATQGAHVVFSDLEREKVERLAERVAKLPARRYEALVCDTNPLPLADNYASRIIAIEMLEHTERPQDILQELVRVGKPGALYLLTVPDPVAEKLQRGIAPSAYYQAPNHVRVFERDEFENTVKDAGLEVVRRTSWGFYWTMWMFFFWVTETAAGREFDGAVLDRINAPYHPLLESWASTWQQLIDMPEGLALKKTMDDFMPKAQAIIARKPG